MKINYLFIEQKLELLKFINVVDQPKEKMRYLVQATVESAGLDAVPTRWRIL